MAADGLIDTTEMYLKTIFELEEDGITPLRARIVERLGHSGPTVSQTISRMERDDLVVVRKDRRLQLTDKGSGLALEVIRKHRLAERLLVDVIGLEWWRAHEEACRWEHVMSAAVEGRLVELLDGPRKDPYGNLIPTSVGRAGEGDGEGEVSLAVLLQQAQDREPQRAVVARIGEPVQSEIELLRDLDDLGIRPGAQVAVTAYEDAAELRTSDQRTGGNGQGTIRLAPPFTNHLFLKA